MANLTSLCTLSLEGYARVWATAAALSPYLRLFVLAISSHEDKTELVSRLGPGSFLLKFLGLQLLTMWTCMPIPRPLQRQTD